MEVKTRVFKCISERKGEHIHMRIFSGYEGFTLALLGTLIMEYGEWQELGAILLKGAERTNGRIKVIHSGYSPKINE